MHFNKKKHTFCIIALLAFVDLHGYTPVCSTPPFTADNTSGYIIKIDARNGNESFVEYFFIEKKTMKLFQEVPDDQSALEFAFIANGGMRISVDLPSQFAAACCLQGSFNNVAIPDSIKATYEHEISRIRNDFDDLPDGIGQYFRSFKFQSKTKKIFYFISIAKATLGYCLCNNPTDSSSTLPKELFLRKIENMTAISEDDSREWEMYICKVLQSEFGHVKSEIIK
jgi:hypothetical protein